MVEITAALVKELRERTGAGMMDCKKALSEVNGQMEEAIDWLRKKGLSAASKKAGRVAAEGLIGLMADGTKGAVVEVNAETDFVARNDQFQQFVRHVTDIVLAHGFDSVESLKAHPYGHGSERTVGEELTHLISIIGENMSLRRLATVSVSTGRVVGYIHNPVTGGMGKIGVLVGLESSAPLAELDTLGKQIAMHVAAANPRSLTVQDLDPSLLEREKSILREQALSSGKPEAVVEKMLEGRLRKFYEEVVLMEQTFVMNPDQTITQVVEAAEKKVGAPIKVIAFLRFMVGEGIEKKEDDFASEVANLSR